MLRADRSRTASRRARPRLLRPSAHTSTHVRLPLSGALVDDSRLLVANVPREDASCELGRSASACLVTIGMGSLDARATAAVTLQLSCRQIHIRHPATAAAAAAAGLGARRQISSWQRCTSRCCYLKALSWLLSGRCYELSRRSTRLARHVSHTERSSRSAAAGMEATRGS